MVNGPQQPALNRTHLLIAAGELVALEDGRFVGELFGDCIAGMTGGCRQSNRHKGR